MKHTTDIWLASFIYTKDSTKLTGCRSSGSKFIFEFDVSDEQWTKLKLEFINSPESNMKYVIERLKDLAYQ